MNCPKCGGAMTPVAFQDVEVDRCQACGGLWFDEYEEGRLKQLNGAETIDSGDPAVGRMHDAIRHVTCPRDGAPMVTVTMPDQPHIHYEQCQTCYGAFFDAGEFADFKTMTVGEWLRSLFR